MPYYKSLSKTATVLFGDFFKKTRLHLDAPKSALA